MATQLEATGFVTLSDEEAAALAGENFNVPDDAKVSEQVWGKGGEKERSVMVAEWDEVAILHEIAVNPGGAERLVERGWPNEPKAAESWFASYQISDKVPSENKGRYIRDFMDFVWSISLTPQAIREQYKETYRGTSDIRRMYQMEFFSLQKNTGKMAQIIRIAGHKDKLAKGRFFGGFGNVFQILPMLKGTILTIRIQQTDDPSGGIRDKVIGVKKVDL